MTEYLKSDEIEVFACHSVPLMRFLTIDKGLNYLVVGLNAKSNDKFWAFVQDKRLSEALTEWKQNKPIVND